MPVAPSRPYVQLGSADLVEQLFEAAFDSDAARFEDLVNEVDERGQLKNIKPNKQYTVEELDEMANQLVKASSGPAK